MKGFTVIELIISLIMVLVVIGVGFLGYAAWHFIMKMW